jgi:hypothetical protein
MMFYSFSYFFVISSLSLSTIVCCSSFLYIDGQELVNNDGLHGDREICQSASLIAGPHEVKVLCMCMCTAHICWLMICDAMFVSGTVMIGIYDCVHAQLAKQVASAQT